VQINGGNTSQVHPAAIKAYKTGLFVAFRRRQGYGGRAAPQNDIDCIITQSCRPVYRFTRFWTVHTAHASTSTLLYLTGDTPMKKLLCVLCLAVLSADPAWARDMQTVTVEELAKTSSSWNGAMLPEYAQGQPEVTILKITLPPKSQLTMHKHPVINAGVLLKGELTVLTGEGKTLHMKAGDPIVEVVDTWHYGKNEGNEAAEIIVFMRAYRANQSLLKKL
jgi:quercetin dioxygenase-like cupin family protein